MFKRKLKHTLSHLGSNSGEGYLWFIFVLLSLMLVFGAILNTLDTAINARKIRNEVQAASEEVLGNIKVVHYDNLSAGATDFAQLVGTPKDVAESLAEKLGADLSISWGEPVLTKKDEKGRESYKISNVEIDYISRINGNENFYYGENLLPFDPSLGDTYFEDMTIKGDIDRDGKVTETDVTLAQKYVNGEEPTYTILVGYQSPNWTPVYKTFSVTLSDVDIDKNGEADGKDIALFKALVTLYAYQEGHKDAATSLLLVTFELEMPVRVGTFEFRTHKNTYSYPMMLSFLPSGA